MKIKMNVFAFNKNFKANVVILFLAYSQTNQPTYLKSFKGWFYLAVFCPLIITFALFKKTHYYYAR